MAAITWKQLVGEADTGAFRAIDAATGTINGAFDSFNKVIASRQAANQTQANIDREGKVAAYLDAVQGANTPEAVEALRQSGQLETLRTGIDPRDLGLIRGADEKRLGATRQSTLAAQDFTKKIREEQLAPLLQQAQVYTNQGDITSLNNFLISNPEVAKYYQGDLTGKGVVGQRAAETHTSAQATAESGRTVAEGKLVVDQRNATANENRVRVENERLGLDRVEKVNTILGKTQERLATMDKGTFNSNEGSKEFNALIDAKFKDDPTRGKTMSRFVGEVMTANPELGRLPPGAVFNAVMSHWNDRGTGAWNPSDGNVVKNITEDLKTQYVAQKSRLDTNDQMRLDLSNEIKKQRELVSGAEREVFPKFYTQLDAAQQAGAGAGTAAGAPVVPPMTDAQRGGGSVSASAPVAAVANFRLDPSLEKKAEEQQLQMSLGSRRLYTPDVDKYLRAKGAAVEALEGQSTPGGPNPAARSPQPAFSLAEQIARRQQQDDPTKKVR